MKRARGIGRRAGVPAVRRRHHANVGDAPVALPGFVPIFQGWNVWDVWQADDPDTGLLGSIWQAGESQERILRVWVEDQIKDNAPGAAVADPANPAALKGAQIQIIPHVPTVFPTSTAKGLSVVATREDIPELAGAMQIGKADSQATLVTVRFYNRGAQTTMPWAHDANFLLDRVYLPSSQNSVTNAPAPSSLAGAASSAADAAGTVVKVVVIGAGVVLASALILSLASMHRKAAA